MTHPNLSKAHAAVICNEKVLQHWSLEDPNAVEGRDGAQGEDGGQEAVEQSAKN